MHQLITDSLAPRVQVHDNVSRSRLFWAPLSYTARRAKSKHGMYRNPSRGVSIFRWRAMSTLYSSLTVKSYSKVPSRHPKPAAFL